MRLITIASRLRVGSLTNSSSETAVCLCSQSSGVISRKLQLTVIDFGPYSPKFGCRKWIRDYSVRIRDIRLIQLRVKSIPETEQGKHAIVRRG